MVGQYEKMLRVLNERFPEWIARERCRKIVEGSDEHRGEIRLWVRYTGNIVLVRVEAPSSFNNPGGYADWRRSECSKLLSVRDYLASEGYTPRLDGTSPEDVVLNPHSSKLMYSFPVGTRIVIDRVSKKKKIVREMPLEDRVYIGFNSFNCEGRTDNL